MKTVAIIQARMGSTRLPGKVMKKLHGKTILSHVVERVKQSNWIDDIVIATTNKAEDDSIEKEAIACGIRIYRGSETNVLERYFYAAKKNNADTIVRITSDCPLIDPSVIDEIISFYQKQSYILLTNAGNESHRSYPRGLDTEVFSFEALQDAFTHANREYQQEHVTPYLYENNQNIYYFKNNIDYSGYRLTLDTIEDFKLIEAIYQRLYNGKHDFYLDDIVHLLKQNPELITINKHIEQKKINE